MDQKNQSKLNRRPTRKLASVRGMTMAELLTVVAILIILAAVAFISVTSYMRSLAQAERDGIAKEIFIAAQNHLTMARGEGYLDVGSNKGQTINGKKYTEEDIFGKVYSGDSAGVRYFIVNDGDLLHDDNSTVLDLMLPFGSIDDTVRNGGHYVIRYQEKTGKVLDVFYCTVGSKAYDFEDDITEDDYDDFLKVGKDDSVSYKARKAYEDGDRKAVLGWYGGDQAASLTEVFLNAPSIRVYNDETLRVVVTDGDGNVDNTGVIKLFITGNTSKEKKAIQLRKSDTDGGRRTGGVNATEYTYILDDIRVSGRHFAELTEGIDGAKTDGKYHGEFIAGEDITIQAVAYSKEQLSNIAFSEEITENSLYESISDPDIQTEDVEKKKERTAYISSIRHLENLEENVSNIGKVNNDPATKHLKIVSAEQTADIKWSRIYSGGSSENIFDYNKDTGRTGFRPISPDDLVLYDGLRHSIESITVGSADENGYAGLFGTLTQSGFIRNLRLKNFSVTGTANAGALAGYLEGATVINVISYNGSNSSNKNATITASGGNAGGLIGHMKGGHIRYSGAAHIVSGSANAGGLIGKAEDSVTVKACYSGGHTEKGGYDIRNNADQIVYNITSDGNAGGLIGDAGSAAISYSYSTCSASGGSNSGGLAGKVSGAGISDCYSTGLVSGNYAFIGSGSASLGESGGVNHYYETVNQDDEGVCKNAVSEGTNVNTDNNFIKPFDDNTTNFNTFTGGGAVWNRGYAYDSTLAKYYTYNNEYKYPFRTVTQLKDNKGKANARIPNSSSGSGAVFVNTHFGDWPAPEIFIINY